MTEVNQQKNEGVMPREIVVDDDISLRFLVPDDASKIFSIFQADPEIQECVTWTHGLEDIKAIQRAIREFQERQSIRYAITEDNQLVGYVGMWHDNGYMDGEDHEGWFGFGYFLDPAHRGKGLVRQATQTMMSMAESVFEVRKWSVYVEDNNEPSRVVLQKLGFTVTDHVFDEPVMHVKERQWEKSV